MKKDKLLLKAKRYRQQGYSLREISEKLNIAKSTASLWLSDVVISSKGQTRLENIKQKAVAKAIAVKKEQRKEYLDKIAKNCLILKKEDNYSINDFKIFLALLFWGEGSKSDRRLVFMNSDPDMIKTFLSLLRKAYSIDENKIKAVLHLHSYHNPKKQIEYWSKVTKIRKENISVYHKKNKGIRKKDNYNGCISIRYGDVRILDELLLIIKRLAEFIPHYSTFYDDHRN